MPKINLISFVWMLTAITIIGLPTIVVQITMAKNNPVQIWQQNFPDYFNRSNEYPPVPQKEGIIKQVIIRAG